MRFRRGSFDGGHAEGASKVPEFNPETATPEQTIEHYRKDPLFEDIAVNLDRAAGTHHEMGPDDRLIVATEAFRTRVNDAQDYLDALSDGSGFPDHSAFLPIKKFMAAATEGQEGSTWLIVNQELSHREQVFRRIKRAVDARAGEFKV